LISEDMVCLSFVRYQGFTHKPGLLFKKIKRTQVIPQYGDAGRAKAPAEPHNATARRGRLALPMFNYGSIVKSGLRLKNFCVISSYFAPEYVRSWNV
jgi:hypothetical protein